MPGFSERVDGLDIRQALLHPCAHRAPTPPRGRLLRDVPPDDVRGAVVNGRTTRNLPAHLADILAAKQPRGDLGLPLRAPPLGEAGASPSGLRCSCSSVLGDILCLIFLGTPGGLLNLLPQGNRGHDMGVAWHRAPRKHMGARRSHGNAISCCHRSPPQCISPSSFRRQAMLFPLHLRSLPESLQELRLSLLPLSRNRR